MKQYKQLISFGCSFTEGGGLNHPTYHKNQVEKEEKKPYLIFSKKPNLQEFATKNSYPAFLADKLECDFYNYGISCGSNELIVKTLYDTVTNKGLTEEHPLFQRKDLQGSRFLVDSDYKNTFITVQFSIMNRILLYLVEDKRLEPINGGYYPKDYVNKLYEMYIKYFYDFNVEYQKALQYIDVYSNFLTSKGIDHLFTFYETPDDSISTSKILASFDGMDLNIFANKHKLRIKDIKHLNFNDAHFTITGNKLIANKLYEHIYDYFN